MKTSGTNLIITQCERPIVAFGLTGSPAANILRIGSRQKRVKCFFSPTRSRNHLRPTGVRQSPGWTCTPGRSPCTSPTCSTASSWKYHNHKLKFYCHHSSHLKYKKIKFWRTLPVLAKNWLHFIAPKTVTGIYYLLSSKTEFLIRIYWPHILRHGSRKSVYK